MDPDVRVLETHREYLLQLRKKTRVFAQAFKGFSNEKTSINQQR